MSENKIQIRSRVVREISRLKAIPTVTEKDVKTAIEQLSDVEDKSFLCQLLLKEISGTMEFFDAVLSLIAINLTRDVFEKTVFTFLEKSDTSEEKKLFLINLLNQAGFSVDPNLIHAYVKNADEVIDLETERFLKLAEVNPEAQIDFLDFYFGVSPKDRYILLSSIIADYSGDLLANILSPLIYTVNNFDVIKMCTEGLLKSRSYLAYTPLDWLIRTSSDKKTVSLAKKTKSELKMAGLRENVSIREYYVELFKDSEPHDAYVSSLDGLSNFSLVFSRRNKTNDAISTFFAVLNLDVGPLSCFGLSHVSAEDYKEVLVRFFRDQEKIPVSFDFAKSLIDEQCNLAEHLGGKVPYELLCWRQLTYDIKGLSLPIEDFLKREIEAGNVTDKTLQLALDCDCGAKWFFTISKRYSNFMDLTDAIATLPEGEFDKFDELTEEFINNPKKSATMFTSLRKRFFYQAYFLKLMGYNNLASLFMGIYLNDVYFLKFFRFSIQKSVYEFFLNIKYMQDTTDKDNIFARQKKIKYYNFNAALMLKKIEEKWTN